MRHAIMPIMLHIRCYYAAWGLGIGGALGCSGSSASPTQSNLAGAGAGAFFGTVTATTGGASHSTPTTAAASTAAGNPQTATKGPGSAGNVAMAQSGGNGAGTNPALSSAANSGGNLSRGGSASGSAMGGSPVKAGAAGNGIGSGGASARGGASPIPGNGGVAGVVAKGGSAGAAVTPKGGASAGGAAASGATVGGAPELAGASGNAPACSGTGWKLLWSDEFNGASGAGVDETSWTFDLGSENGGWGNNELEFYTKEPKNVSTDGKGNLVITAIKESQGGKDYTSARLKTQGLKTWQYGRIEGRMKLPSGQGIWPAFWMLGSDIATNTWPKCGEIDIMENVGKEPNIVHGSLHGPGYSGGSPLTASYTLPNPVSEDFHLFAVEWDATSIKWYVDDKMYSTKTTADVPSGSTWVYTHPFFIILNVAVGGTWPGSPDSTTKFPQQMLVDYIRVCQR